MAHSTYRRVRPARWGAVTVLLIAAVAAALWVPWYSRTKPKLGDFPFFYWYLLALVPVVAGACWFCHLLLKPGRARKAEYEDDGWG